MNVQKEILRLNDQELEANTPFEASWHQTYKYRPWIYVGGLDTQLNEGDIITVFSQWGEIEDLNLVRDQETGKSRGFAYIRYEDWRSTVLAVDNMNGTKLLNRSLTVDHKMNYKKPEEKEHTEEKKERHRSRSNSSHRHHRSKSGRNRSRDRSRDRSRERRSRYEHHYRSTRH